MSNSNDYEIGYKKPPVESQFKPGQSGSPAGRPKNGKNKAPLLERLLFEQHSIKLGGRKRRLSAFEIMVYQTRNKALQGERTAIRNWTMLTNLCGVTEKKLPPEEEPHVGILIIPWNVDERLNSPSDGPDEPNSKSADDQEDQ